MCPCSRVVLQVCRYSVRKLPQQQHPCLRSHFAFVENDRGGNEKEHVSRECPITLTLYMKVIRNIRFKQNDQEEFGKQQEKLNNTNKQ